jgi:hypothetical protein
MPSKRPSFLKRQKEQKRHERAAAKRDARRGKSEARKAEERSVVQMDTGETLPTNPEACVVKQEDD